jgi:hypothetical protein
MKTIRIGADVPVEQQEAQGVEELTLKEFIHSTLNLGWRWVMDNKSVVGTTLGATFIMVASVVGWVMTSLLWP